MKSSLNNGQPCDALAGLTPLDVLARWPVDEPIMMLHSGGADPRWARWSIMAKPQKWIACQNSNEQSCDREGAPLCVEALESLPHGRGSVRSELPFTSGWVGYLSYDLGCAIEPAAQCASRPHEDRNWPLYTFAHCPAALVFDHMQQCWFTTGDVDRANELVHLLSTSPLAPRPSPLPNWSAGDLRSSMTPDTYRAAIAQTKQYIAQGDIFQANITQRLTTNFAGSTRALAHAALTASNPHYGAYLELPDGRTLISTSPELFLEVRHDHSHSQSPSHRLTVSPSHRITTRPIKGTRRASIDPAELIHSEKDAAELHMIVDLMRNDLGRVCEYGSVRVPNPRSIETYHLREVPSTEYRGASALNKNAVLGTRQSVLAHTGIHHGVAEITGTLRENITMTDLLRATFPAGSITGAPKIRAMQIIDEIEPVRRGPYTGSIGYITDDGCACFNVAIRTLAMTGTRPANRFDTFADALLDYGSGGGIVADSDPAAEYRESHDKAEILRMLLAQNALAHATV